MKDLRRIPSLRSAVLGALITACSSTSEGADTGGSEGATGAESNGDSGGGDPMVLVGSFLVQVNEPTDTGAGTTTVIGKVYDGRSPDTVVWEGGTAMGDCQLFEPRVPFCSTPCGGSAACVEDETCVPYPSALDVGEVTVTGVATADGDSSFTMEAIAGNYQPKVSLAYPAFAAGDPIGLAAAGGDIGGFDIAGVGIDQLVAGGDPIPLSHDTDVQLTWTAAAEPNTNIHVKLDISHHGGSKGKIECDTADTGTLTLPAALVGELLDLGVAGFPTVILTREATASTTIAAGRVDLVVSSAVERAITVEGVTSCTDDTQCADGQTCQADLTCA